MNGAEDFLAEDDKGVLKIWILGVGFPRTPVFIDLFASFPSLLPTLLAPSKKIKPRQKSAPLSTFHTK